MALGLKEPAIEIGELCLNGMSRGCDRIVRADETSSKLESNEPGWSCIRMLGRFVVSRWILIIGQRPTAASQVKMGHNYS